MSKICYNKLKQLNCHEYKLSTETLNACKCDNCKDDICDDYIIIYNKMHFEIMLKQLLKELNNCELFELTSYLICGHFSEHYNDIDYLMYTAGVITAYNRNVRWNQVYLGDSALTRLKHIGKRAISKKEYQKYYNKYKNIIDEVYNKNGKA